MLPKTNEKSFEEYRIVQKTEKEIQIIVHFGKE
jgi:hypothetical protein